MILEDATHEAFGYEVWELLPQSSKGVIAACELCGEFRILRRDTYRTFCISCAHTLINKGSISRVCPICKKSFKACQSIVKKGCGIYCSRKCTAESRKVEKIKCVCPTCKKIFFVWPSTIKFGRGVYCSNKCKNADNMGKVERECLVCGKKIFVAQWEIKDGRGKYCSVACWSKAQLHNKKPHMTAPEKIFESICINKNLPFRFVGDGALWLGNANPDFIHNTKKIVVEVFGDYFHSPLLKYNVRDTHTLEGRKKQLKAEGYKSIFIWESDLKRKDTESFVMQLMLKEGII